MSKGTFGDNSGPWQETSAGRSVPSYGFEGQFCPEFPSWCPSNVAPLSAKGDLSPREPISDSPGCPGTMGLWSGLVIGLLESGGFGRRVWPADTKLKPRRDVHCCVTQSGWVDVGGHLPMQQRQAGDALTLSQRERELRIPLWFQFNVRGRRPDGAIGKCQYSTGGTPIPTFPLKGEGEKIPFPAGCWREKRKARRKLRAFGLACVARVGVDPLRCG